MKTLKELRKEFDRAQIIQRLFDFDWNISAAAISLKIERAHLHRLVLALNIRRPKALLKGDDEKA